jgi:hypothetical protein
MLIGILLYKFFCVFLEPLFSKVFVFDSMVHDLLLQNLSVNIDVSSTVCICRLFASFPGPRAQRVMVDDV